MRPSPKVTVAVPRDVLDLVSVERPRLVRVTVCPSATAASTIRLHARRSLSRRERGHTSGWSVQSREDRTAREVSHSGSVTHATAPSVRSRMDHARPQNSKYKTIARINEFYPNIHRLRGSIFFNSMEGVSDPNCSCR